MPKFAQSPAYQTLTTRVKAPAGTMSILSLSARGGTSAAEDTVPRSDTEASSGLKKQQSGQQLASQGSADLDAPSTARESTFEDVLAGLTPRVGHNLQLESGRSTMRSKG